MLGQHRSTQRRIPRGRDDEDRLVADMIELARRYGRYGYRRIAALLRDAGWQVNDKRVERLWRREGLKVPGKQPKRGCLWLNDGSCIRLRAERPNHVWSYAFVHHRTHDGRAFRTLNVLDEFTRESLAIRVRRKLSSTDVIDVLTDLFILRGVPAYVRSDNGPEFVAEAVRRWIAAVGARTAFIEPGSPWENGYIESFNARLRDELLNGEIFYTLREAQVLIEAWRRHHNAVRPPGSLGYRLPARKRSFRRAGRPAPPRSAGHPARPRNRQCTNIQTGPVSGGRSASWSEFAVDDLRLRRFLRFIRASRGDCCAPQPHGDTAATANLHIVRNYHIFLTEGRRLVERLSEAILHCARTQPEGVMMAAKGLLHLGSRAAVDQALSRLARRGELLRAGRGLYVLPVKSRFGTRAPSLWKTVEALATQRGERIASSGAVAANKLGLTTQVPVKPVFLTSGRSRKLRLGSQEIELRHAPAWQLVLADGTAGDAVRALAWLGPEKAEAALGKIRQSLSAEERGELAGVTAQLPGWLAGPVTRLAHG